MELRFCDECGSRISDEALADGRAVALGDVCYCPRCRKMKASSGELRALKPGTPSRGNPSSSTRLKRSRAGSSSALRKALKQRPTPSSTKLPKSGPKVRASSSKMQMPAVARWRSGAAQREAADWGRTVFNGVMLLVGGAILGYLGLMLWYLRSPDSQGPGGSGKETRFGRPAGRAPRQGRPESGSIRRQARSRPAGSDSRNPD